MDPKLKLDPIATQGCSRQTIKNSQISFWISNDKDSDFTINITRKTQRRAERSKKSWNAFRAVCNQKR